jgi:hypothetical protein
LALLSLITLLPQHKVIEALQIELCLLILRIETERFFEEFGGIVHLFKRQHDRPRL